MAKKSSSARAASAAAPIVGVTPRTAKPTLRPYYQAEREPDEAWARDARDLVGFDVDDALSRLQGWLATHRYMNVDEQGRSIEVEGRRSALPPDQPVKGESSKDKKARAALKAIARLHEHQTMFGPERLAQLRWLRELGRLLASLKHARPYAVVRYSEEGFFANHALGSSYGVKLRARAARVGRLVSKFGAFERAVRDAEQAVPRYRDLLPDIDAEGRPKRAFLASIETTLYDGGFIPIEIGALVIDDRRGVGALERKAHAERISMRVRRYRTARDKRRVAEEPELQDLDVTPERLATISARPRRPKKPRTQP